MQITNNTATTASGSSQNAQLNDVGFDTFLTLLTVQLQHQDPMNPMEGTEFTNQIATFSQLEQTTKSNSLLESIAGQADYSAQAVAVSYIGKEALAQSDTLTLETDGAATDFAYELDSASSLVVIEIFSPTGEVVKRLEPSSHLAGTHEVSWDGKLENGNDAPAGQYIMKLSAVDSEGSKSNGKLLTYSRVTGVESTDTGLNLNLSDGRFIDFNSVVSVREASDA